MEKKKFEKLREEGRVSQAPSSFDFAPQMDRREPEFATQESEFRASNANIRFIRDKGQRFSAPGKKQSKPKITIQRILDDVLDKEKWQGKWRKIKDFVKNKKRDDGKGQSAGSERDQVFNTLLALYAGDDEEEVFSELNGLYERYPQEIEFYIP